MYNVGTVWWLDTIVSGDRAASIFRAKQEFTDGLRTKPLTIVDSRIYFVLTELPYSVPMSIHGYVVM